MRAWRIRWVLLGLSIALSASSCAVQPNSADIRFVAEMIPHHELGMTLIDVATTNAGDVRLRRLVFEMGNYHHHDMMALRNLAKDWNVKPASSFPGELPKKRVQLLRQQMGIEHDVGWLHLMITHHLGALQIAEMSIDRSDSPAVQRLARATKEVQAREINEMRLLLAELCKISTLTECTK